MSSPKTTNVLLAIVAILLIMILGQPLVGQIIPTAYAQTNRPSPAPTIVLGCFKEHESWDCQWIPIRVDRRGVILRPPSR